MYRAGHQFLTRSGFAQNQHGCIGRGHLADVGKHRLHSRALTDDFAKIIAGSKFFGQVGFLLFQPLAKLVNLLKGKHIIQRQRHLNANVL